MTGRGDQQRGYAAVDALVALAILGAILSLALGAVGAGNRLAGATLDSRRAAGLLTGLAEAGDLRPGATAGRDGRFDWRLTVTAATPDAKLPDIRVCERRVQATSRATGRRYQLTTYRFCSPGGAA